MKLANGFYTKLDVSLLGIVVLFVAYIIEVFLLEFWQSGNSTCSQCGSCVEWTNKNWVSGKPKFLN